MAQTIDLLKNSSFEQGIADLVSAIQTQSSQYTLPIAGSTTRGGVTVGERLSIDNNGTLTQVHPNQMLILLQVSMGKH